MGRRRVRIGSGSAISNTINFHDVLLKLLKEYEIRTLLEAPCVDFNWMKDLNLQLDSYIGIDIVNKLVEENNKKYGNEIMRFMYADVTKDELPLFVYRKKWRIKSGQVSRALEIG